MSEDLIQGDPVRPKARLLNVETDSTPAGLKDVWKIFTTQPGLGVLLFGPDRLIEYVNDHIVREYFPFPEMVGHPISEFVEEPVARGVEEAIEKIKGTDTILIRKAMFKGHETLATYRWLALEGHEAGRILLTIQRGFTDSSLEGGVEVERGGYIHLGSLSVLTNRELEVLALIGEGLRVKEVGARLFRSPKTVESHLSSIYRKLKTSDRAVLMQMANEAGLDFDIVNRIRVEAVDSDQDEE